MSKLSWRVAAILIALPAVAALGVRSQEVDSRVLDTESKRIAVIDKVKPSVVAVFAEGGQGGGSGVLISKEGYALTNFHVVGSAGPIMQCGLADGVLYDAVLVGLDKVGDIALIKLLPKKAGLDFPAATLGDSDKVRAGDWTLALGNPFLLATDFNPTVTYGVVSGVHRYQYPEGTLLEYTDCIQIDTSINPGNSGGPLFNMAGELIGINGRGSFEKRARVNSGVGYAISINQIKNFLGHLRAGIDTDHATLGALVTSSNEEDEGAHARLKVDQILEDADAARRGLQQDDEIVAFAGRPMTSVNQFKNVLGLFPKGWRVPLTYRRGNEKHQILVRLMQVQQRQQEEEGKPKRPSGPPQAKQPARTNPALKKLYEPRPGFANYYFNRLERGRLMAAFHKHGDFAVLAGDWTFEASADVNQKKTPTALAIREEVDQGDAQDRPGSYYLDANSLPPLPDPDGREDAFRTACRKTLSLLKAQAQALPQEFRGADEGAVKQQVAKIASAVTALQPKLQEALTEMRRADKARDKQPPGWQAGYDYLLGELTSFAAYAAEYQWLLGQLDQQKPSGSVKQQRGWQMLPQDKPRSGAAAVRLAREADAIWTQMGQDYKGTVWAERAQAASRVPLGLKWEPLGGTHTVVHFKIGPLDYQLDPLRFGQEAERLQNPPGSGGLLVALYQYRRLLTMGPAGFEQYAAHGGHEPFYPPRTDGTTPQNLNDLRVDTEVLLTEHAAVPAKWYFSLKDQTLLGFEVGEPGVDPCEVYFSEYRTVDGRQLPHRIEVRHGDKQFAVLTVRSYQLAAAK
jgi:S1-C subfamily serine protease